MVVISITVVIITWRKFQPSQNIEVNFFNLILTPYPNLTLSLWTFLRPNINFSPPKHRIFHLNQDSVFESFLAIFQNFILVLLAQTVRKKPIKLYIFGNFIKIWTHKHNRKQCFLVDMFQSLNKGSITSFAKSSQPKWYQWSILYCTVCPE